MRLIIFFLLAASVLIHADGISDTMKVPGEYPTIQEAINASDHGDIILVSPGTYVENINYKGKAITIRSDVDGNPATFDTSPKTTIIDGNKCGNTVMFEQEEGPDSVLKGFTITNGTGFTHYNNTYGGGILCWVNPFPTFTSGNEGSSPTIEGNIITGNRAVFGAGICCIYDSAPTIKENLITNNRSDVAWSRGGGIWCESDSTPEIVGNIIIENKSAIGGGIACRESGPHMANNLVAYNEAALAGGIFLNKGFLDIKVTHCTIIGNKSSMKGGGIYVNDNIYLTVTSTILWDNEADQGGKEIAIGDYSLPTSSLTISHSDVQGGTDSLFIPPNCTLTWDENSMIDADPLLADPQNGDFHLCWDSPCINRGVSRCHDPSDLDGDIRPEMGTCDIGTDEFTGVHSLSAGAFELSATTGGTVDLHLTGGTGNGGREYIVLASATGTVPGIPLGWGNVVLPLKYDSFTDFVFAWSNTPLFPDFIGTLSASGEGQARICSGPLRPGYAGITMYYAFVLLHPCDFASTPLAIEITL